MSGALLVVVAMKAPCDAKTRLAPGLADGARSRLAVAMFEHTLAFFAAHYPDLALASVTPSLEIAARAQRLGAAAILEGRARGLNAAAARAARWGAAQGYPHLLLVPADVPVWSKTEVDALLAAAAAHAVVIAEATDGGTNALLLREPVTTPFRFGPDSARRHEQAALAQGRSCLRLRLPCLSRDVDHPEDLPQVHALLGVEAA